MPTLSPATEDFIKQALSEQSLISEERKDSLVSLAAFLKTSHQQGQLPAVQAICTHNSRRSQIAQVWLYLAAIHFDFPMQSFSGGTEATAFNPRSVEALRRVGIPIQKVSEEENPHYLLDISTPKGFPPLGELFSKVYDDPHNESPNFLAMMVCDQAAEACPVVHGAKQRLPIMYKDPKYADDTPEEAKAYDACVRQVAREMLFTLALASE